MENSNNEVEDKVVDQFAGFPEDPADNPNVCISCQ
jgi:hypothetical protein